MKRNINNQEDITTIVGDYDCLSETVKSLQWKVSRQDDLLRHSRNLFREDIQKANQAAWNAEIKLSKALRRIRKLEKAIMRGGIVIK